jgi:hypothetical protein
VAGGAVRGGLGARRCCVGVRRQRNWPGSGRACVGAWASSRCGHRNSRRVDPFRALVCRPLTGTGWETVGRYRGVVTQVCPDGDVHTSARWWQIRSCLTTTSKAGKSDGPDSRAADDRSIAGTGLRLATRPGQPDHLSLVSHSRLGNGLVGSRRRSDAGTERIWLLGARADHGL